jgi:hypothetical protein
MNYRAVIQPAALTEREWSAQVYELCHLLRYRRYHTYRSKHSPAGFPDETLVRERVVFLELKTDAKTSRCSPAQKDWLRALLAAGAEAYVCRPSDWDDLAQVLRARNRVFTGPAWDAHERLVERTRTEVE